MGGGSRVGGGSVSSIVAGGINKVVENKMKTGSEDPVQRLRACGVALKQKSKRR